MTYEEDEDKEPTLNEYELELPTPTRGVVIPVILNGHHVKAAWPIWTYEDIAFLTYGDPKRILSVIWNTKAGDAAGILHPGTQVLLSPGMIINSYDTSYA